LLSAPGAFDATPQQSGIGHTVHEYNIHWIFVASFGNRRSDACASHTISAHFWQLWREHKQALLLREDDRAEEKAGQVKPAKADLANLARKLQKRTDGAVVARRQVRAGGEPVL